MSLLTILISLALERLLPPLEHLRGLDWFSQYTDWIRRRLGGHPRWQGIPALLITVLLPVIAVGVLQSLFADILDVLVFLFGIIVLSFCLGPRNPLYVAHKYQDALEHGDTDEAQTSLEFLLPDGIPEDEAVRAEALVETVLIQNHERLLAILFWFVVLGPMGAVLYLLAAYQAQHARRNPDPDILEFSAAAAKLHDLLAWIPCRLTALSYAVMGSFVHALQAWEISEAPGVDEAEFEETKLEEIEAAAKTHTVPIIPDSHGLLLRVGLGALQFDDEPPKDTSTVRETFALCLRSVIAWLTILALLTLAGWAA